MYRYKYLILTQFFFLVSCKDKRLLTAEKIIGSWSVERDAYSKGTLKINPGKTFNFSETRDTSKTYANGNWRIENDTLILTSIMAPECLYVNNFAQYCEDKSIVVKPYIETTIENCDPKKSENFYTKFNDEKFVIKGPSIFYINTNKDCANEQFETKIHR